MPQDPRPHTARTVTGAPDQDTERRFEVLFETLRPLNAPRPTDAASALTFVQELWDRLNGR